MGFTNRFSTLLKQRLNTLLDNYEGPKGALDYSYMQQVETLNRFHRNIVEVVTANKRLEIQKMRLWDNVRNLDEQAHRADDSNREDLEAASDNDIEAELKKMTVKSSVDKELAKLNANAKKNKNQPEGQSRQKTDESKVEEEEQPVVAE